MPGVKRVAEALLLEGADDLVDTVWNPPLGREAELAADLLEADLVVARVLVALDEADLAAVQLALDLLDEERFGDPWSARWRNIP